MLFPPLTWALAISNWDVWIHTHEWHGEPNSAEQIDRSKDKREATEGNQSLKPDPVGRVETGRL